MQHYLKYLCNYLSNLHFIIRYLTMKIMPATHSVHNELYLLLHKQLGYIGNIILFTNFAVFYTTQDFICIKTML